MQSAIKKTKSVLKQWCRIPWLYVIFPVLCLAQSRGDYLKIANPSVQCYCHPEDQLTGEKTIDLLNQAMPDLAKQYGLFQKGTVTVVIAVSEEEFDRLTQHQIPDWGAGAADSKHSIVYLKSPRMSGTFSQFSSVLMHELSHVLLGQHAKNQKIDRWFDEGLAMTVAEENPFWGRVRIARAARTDQLIYLTQMDDVLRYHKSKAALAYAESVTAVQLMAELAGDSVYGEIVGHLENHSWPEAFELSMGMPVGAFEAHFFDAMKDRYRWYLFVDFQFYFCFIFVNLFVWVYIIKRRQAKLKLQAWDMEQNEEDIEA